MVRMSDDIDQELLDQLNRLVRVRYKIATEHAEENRRHMMADEQISAHEATIDKSIWKLIDQHRDELLAGDTRSFVTYLARFQLRKVPGRQSVTDSKAVMAIARGLGIVRRIATPPKNTWRFNSKLFFEWLEQHGEQRGFFDEFIEETTDDDSLSIKLNEGHNVEFSHRLTPGSITVKKGSPRT